MDVPKHTHTGLEPFDILFGRVSVLVRQVQDSVLPQKSRFRLSALFPLVQNQVTKVNKLSDVGKH